MADSSTTASPHTNRPSPDSLGVRYVEVEQIEWREKRVPKKEYVEVIKEVKVPQIVEVERPVEVTEYHDVVREVPIDQVEEIMKDVEKVEVIDCPVEQIKTVPKIQKVQREEVRQVPGEVIVVERPYQVERKIPVYNYIDRDQPVVVAQSARPIIKTNAVSQPILARDYDPVLCKVLIHIPKPISTQLSLAEQPVTKHSYLGRIPATQWNQLLRGLNPTLADEHLKNLWTADAHSHGIPPIQESIPIVIPRGHIEGHPAPRPLPAWPVSDRPREATQDEYDREEWNYSLPPIPVGTGRDRSAERHYRIHHSYFRSPSPLPRPSKIMSSRPSHHHPMNSAQERPFSYHQGTPSTYYRSPPDYFEEPYRTSRTNHHDDAYRPPISLLADGWKKRSKSPRRKRHHTRARAAY